jgi:uncharacterized protein (DUF934 family)
MMALVIRGKLVEDHFVDIAGTDAPLPAGAVIVSLEQWTAHREQLVQRAEPVGVRLRSDQTVDALATDLEHLAMIALEFPAFKDGRAYSQARRLRERFGFKGELRAVGDVLLEQLHFMQRVGFDAFEIDSPDPLGDYQAAAADFSVWYQPASDGRPTAIELRHRLIR